MKTNALLVFATAFAFAIYPSNAQLIVNGGFETPDTPTYTYIYPGENTLAPWVVPGPNPVEVGDALGNGFITAPAFEGVQMLDLHGRLTQAFATTPGSLYTITFAYTDHPVEPATLPPASAKVRLFDGLGDCLNRTFTHTGAGSNDLHWTIFNELFTAVQTITTLEFTPLTSVPSGLPGGILLDAVQVQVIDRVTILSQPRNTNTPAGSNVTLSVFAISPLPIAYQWQFNGVDLPGQTGSALTLTNLQFANDGLYTVVVADALGSATSEPAAVRVLIKPVIVQGPISQSVVAGGSVTFSTEITGNPAPFLYQWRQGSTILTNMVLSEKGAFFTLNNVRTNQAGLYRVVITNAASPSLTLNATWNLTVLPDTDADGLPDAWETAHGLSATELADAALDSDGDGQSNLNEYQAGTNPTNAASSLKLEGVTHANGHTAVSFNAISNHTYTVEWCADVGATWNKLADLIARTNNRVESVIDKNEIGPTRFYRLATPRRP